MVFFVRITVNQSHLRPICKSTKFNPKIQRTIYSINFQRLRLHVLGFIRTVVPDFLRMGLATYMHESAIEYYKKRGCLVAELYHVCNESYKLGKSLGFVEKKETKETSIVSMVKILTDTRRQNRKANVRFVVWDNCYGDTNLEPIYSWSLDFRRNKKTIICSIDYEWTVGIIQDKKVVYSGIAKRFFDVIPIGEPYLYINEEKAKYILESIQRYCHN